MTDINNPAIVKHKGRPPKRLKSNVETSLVREKQVLKDSVCINIIDDKNVIDETSNMKGRRCGKCRQYGHYSKTCQNDI